MFISTSVTNPYVIYISSVFECAAMLGQSKNCNSLQVINASLKSINDLKMSA